MSEELFDLDPAELEFQCPRCEFYNPITFGEARLCIPILCRGCKNTITPDDPMGDLDFARRRIASSMQELKESLERLGK